MYYASIRSLIQETHGLIKQSVLSQIQLQRIPSWHTGQSDFTASPAENMSLHLAHATTTTTTTTPHNWRHNDFLLKTTSKLSQALTHFHTLSEVSHIQQNRNPIQSVTDCNVAEFFSRGDKQMLETDPLPPPRLNDHRDRNCLNSTARSLVIATWL